MQNKPNTWKDFIACAEYLVEKNYTSTGYLAGQGGSAGGITIGRAITERPDLFQAAIINVGDLDMLRIETTTNGVPNIKEFGTVKDEAGFKGLLSMSSLHHVRDGVDYPAVLLTHGINEPRVAPWTSAKMTARLQAATSGHRPNPVSSAKIDPEKNGPMTRCGSLQASSHFCRSPGCYPGLVNSVSQ
jgi:prolyl oligopeptidase